MKEERDRERAAPFELTASQWERRLGGRRAAVLRVAVEAWATRLEAEMEGIDLDTGHLLAIEKLHESLQKKLSRRVVEWNESFAEWERLVHHYGEAVGSPKDEAYEPPEYSPFPEPAEEVRTLMTTAPIGSPEMDADIRAVQERAMRPDPVAAVLNEDLFGDWLASTSDP